MADFRVFSAAVNKRFNEMAQDRLFIVDADRDKIWETYLEAFPADSNKIFRVRREYDCSCCRSFIRAVGPIVAIQNGAISTIWDLNGLPEPFQTVADRMAAYVKSLAISDVFLTPFSTIGTAASHEQIDGGVRTWNHFSVQVPQRHISQNVAEESGVMRTTHHVLARGLAELTPDAVATVAGLIQDNAIYRGQEFQGQVFDFQALQERFLSITDKNSRELLAWTMVDSPVARIRNTVIGTLMQDLSDGVDVEAAVRAYETKVAPANYKRPTALITKRMVEDAMSTIRELDLESALERRHARFSDVSVNSVLFVDNAVRGKMKGGVEQLLMEEVKPQPFDPERATEIAVDKFMEEVLPGSSSVRLYLAPEMIRNFMSLTAPVDENAGKLFKWENNFAWAYTGDVADSIKDKVKRAGGIVENVSLRVSLAWFNTDDLDLHCTEPNGNHVHFYNKSNILDIDMNVRGETRQPVENMRWLKLPHDGVYRFWVNNFTKRESIDVGFIIEIESTQIIRTFRYEKAVPNKGNQPVANVEIKNGQVHAIKVADGIIAGAASQDFWGLKTLDLVPVNSIIISPNYWDGNATGNKHHFFILEGCRNPQPARGVFNEFLNSRLEKHRKVFEVLGDKTKCPVASEQMSGVGFSSGRKDKATVLVSKQNRTSSYTLMF
jgi:hypothetical protein